jgi:hypothetical protein
VHSWKAFLGANWVRKVAVEFWRRWASWRAFLSDKSYRDRFVYLPKRSSWLNQIETIFGVTNCKALRRASNTSMADLQTRITEFIDNFNHTMARPFNWTYTDCPGTASPDERPRTWKVKWVARRNLKKNAVSTQC